MAGDVDAELLELNRRAPGGAAPEEWAAFVCQGDPSPLTLLGG
jgi:hypothetical protein